MKRVFRIREQGKVKEVGCRALATWRRMLQVAYEQPTYEQAKAARLTLRKELRRLNTLAVASLDEGFEDTLTLHRLGLFQALGVSLKTTNCLKSLNAELGQVTDKVDRWRTSDQKQRWVASALLTIEPRLRADQRLPPPVAVP